MQSYKDIEIFKLGQNSEEERGGRNTTDCNFLYSPLWSFAFLMNLKYNIIVWPYAIPILAFVSNHYSRIIKWQFLFPILNYLKMQKKSFKISDDR